jgi:flagellar biosynthetic protein FliP
MSRWLPLLLLLACLTAGEAPAPIVVPPDAPPTAGEVPIGPPIAAQPGEITIPVGGTAAPAGPGGGLTIRIDGPAGGDYSSAVTILLVITALAIAPAFLMMMTSFTRIIIVLGFLRRALGTQTLPPNQVMLGLALFLSLFIMAPTLRSVNEKAFQPWMRKEITQEVAVQRAEADIKQFMLKNTRKNDLALFIRLAGDERPRSADDVKLLTLIPAFATSELKTAFQMGFVIFLPFLVIDLVVSAVLMAMGMMMLPPVVVSLPFKLLLFVLVDGWTLLVSSLVASYR